MNRCDPVLLFSRGILFAFFFVVSAYLERYEKLQIWNCRFSVKAQSHWAYDRLRPVCDSHAIIAGNLRRSHD